MLLTALRRAGIKVPTLCHIDGLTPTGACRMCVVEVEGPAGPGAELRLSRGRRHEGPARTRPAPSRPARRSSNCCWPTIPTTACTASATATASCSDWPRSWASGSRRFAGDRTRHTLDTSSPSIVRDPAKCILCGKCVRVCEEIQRVVGHRLHRPRLAGQDRHGLRRGPERLELRELRPVHHGLPHRGPDREEPDPGSHRRPERHGQAGRRAARPGRFGGLGRGIRRAPGHRHGRGHDHRPALAGLRPRLRHLLRRRPDDHGRRLASWSSG